MDKKPLYLAKSMAELQKKSELSHHEFSNIKSSCFLLDKLYEKIKQAHLERDEELGYVYSVRFLDTFSRIRKYYKTDINYISALIGSSKPIEVMDIGESLKISLKERYESINLLVKGVIKEERKEQERPEGHDIIVTNNSGGLVTCKNMHSLLKTGRDNILIVDTRRETDFLQCHISGGKIVNIPSEELRPGCSIVDVDACLKKKGDAKQINIWKDRGSVTLVIILDWDMTVLNGIHRVKDAIYKWDAEKTIKEPLLLEGGFKSFLLHYPTMVSAPQYKGPSDDSDNQHHTIDPGNIKYPDLNAIEMAKRRRQEEIENKIKEEAKERKRVQEEESEKKKCAEEKEEEERGVKGELTEQSLEDKFKKLRSEAIVDTSLAESPPLFIDRSLKPELFREDVFSDDHKSPPELPLTPLKVDRTLKPQNKSQDKAINDGEEVTMNHKSPLLRRLSSNSRTDQDRSDFAARGGAKSIPPPPSVAEPEKIKLPPWVYREFDKHTNEHYYVDRRTNTRYTTVPDQCITNNDNEKLIVKKQEEVTATHVDRVEPLKDHSSHKSKHSSGVSPMKRSTSQPNLSDEAVIDSTTHPVNDFGTSRDPPRLDRLTKPIHTKSFNEFDANRLSSFNPTYRKVIPGLTGLHNMGNTCYMNSVIQALSNTKFLSNYILTGNYRHDINRNNPLGYQGELINEFAILTTALWKGLYKEISPYDFKRMVDSKNEMFRGGEQHDSQEFLLFILDGLHEDLNIGTRQVHVDQPVANEHVSDVEKAQQSWKAHVAVNDSVIVRMFQGQYRSTVTCDHCLWSSVTFDAFMYLSLPLVTTHSRCSLDDCIKLFLAEEKMTGSCQWFCPKCKANRNAKKKIDIWKLPPYLLIHLKRFSCSGQYRQKLNTFVDFPMDDLSLSEILSRTSTQAQTHDEYHLYAVSNHHGNMESGHYTSYCKNVAEKGWYNYDDDIVTRIKESEVKTPSAYILFYESYNIKKALHKN